MSATIHAGAVAIDRTPLKAATAARTAAGHRLDRARDTLRATPYGYGRGTSEHRAARALVAEAEAAYAAAEYELDTALLTRPDVAYPEDLARIRAERGL